uniref:F-box domain-containing protein n=1 Tax=Mycena chlorophos TaxID=658473 RepID=A0ABQ0L1P3_MYCCL|nr:predicted protein [Mycena chlorophos]
MDGIPSDDSPRLPPELERRIFVVTALSHRGAITVLLRVAHRVHTWIEPLLYRRFEFIQSPEFRACRRAFQHNPALLSWGTREVIVPNNAYTEKLGLAEIHEIIHACSNLEGLAFARDLTSPDLLPAISELPIRRLKLGVSNLLLGPEPRPDPLAAAQLLRNVTHFEYLGDIYLSSGSDSDANREVGPTEILY